MVILLFLESDDGLGGFNLDSINLDDSSFSEEPVPNEWYLYIL